MKWFYDLENWMCSLFGINFVIHFEDITVFLSGIFIGILIMAALCGKVIFKIKKDIDMGTKKINLVRFKHEGFKHYVANPNNIAESIETLLLVIFRPLFQDKEYTYRDERRTKIFLSVIFLSGIIILILAIMCVTSVVNDHIVVK